MRNLVAASWLAALLALPARGDDWTHLGRDDGRTRAPSEALAGSLAALPVLSTGSSSAASPVAADGILVTAGLDGRVRAFREADRALLWTAVLGGPVIATPLADRGRLYVPCTDGRLSALRLADGALLWTLDTNGADQSSPVLSGGRLYLGSGFPNAALLAVDPAAGTLAWSAPLDQVTSSSPAVAAGRVFIGANSGRLFAFDAGTGALAWTCSAGGTVGTASPLAEGGAVYLVSDAAFHRVEPGAESWSLALSDPAPPAGALGVDWAASSPAKAGAYVAFAVRFNYHMNLDGDPYGTVDGRILREFAFVVDPAAPPAMRLKRQALLGEATVPDVNGIPPYGLCPTPVANGTRIVFASSVAALLALLDPETGAASTLPLDAPCLASPVVANARLLALSRPGTLHAFQGANAPPGAPAGLSPDGVDLDAAPPSLSWSAAEPEYAVRLDDDGEVLADWDFEAVVSGGSVPIPALADGRVYTWGVRARDAEGARGPWSTAQFGLNVPPQPPAGLAAAPGHQKVALTWSPSPSAGVTGYRLVYVGASLDLGLVTSATVTGLANGTAYTFELRAVDSGGDLSAPAVVTATPVATITVSGAGFDSLQAAAAAARPGQTIELGGETYALSGTLALPAGVHLRGAGALATRVVAAGPFVMVVAGGGNDVGLLTLAGGSVGLRAAGQDVRLRNAVIRDMADAGVVVEGTAELVNNTIVRNAAAGVRVLGAASARNNILQENGLAFEGAAASSYNDVVGPSSGWASGPGDFSAPVAFVDPASGDFREAPGQPSVDAGHPADDWSLEPAPNGGRVNAGAFGNTPLAAASNEPPLVSSSSRGRCSASASPPSPGVFWLLSSALLLVLSRRRPC